MGPSASARWGNRLVAWCGLIVGVLVALPPLLRLGQEGWTGPNVSGHEKLPIGGHESAH